MPRQPSRRRKPGAKPLNLKRFSASRLRSLIRRIDVELHVLNLRIAGVPKNVYKEVSNAEIMALYARSVEARALLAGFDRTLMRFAAAYPALGSFPTRVNGARMVRTS